MRTGLNVLCPLVSRRARQAFTCKSRGSVCSVSCKMLVHCTCAEHAVPMRFCFWFCAFWHPAVPFVYSAVPMRFGDRVVPFGQIPCLRATTMSKGTQRSLINICGKSNTKLSVKDSFAWKDAISTKSKYTQGTNSYSH